MPDYGAIDLGATSGRVFAGALRDGRVELRELHRFENRPVRLPGGLHWNLLTLFAEAVDGLRGLDVQGVGAGNGLDRVL